MVHAPQGETCEILCAGAPAGQAEPLVARIRGLIRDYPPGIGIVKEFLQNADDAGATWLNLVLDLRTHPTERLPDRRMVPLLGPALLVISNQVFSDKDLQAIQEIGEGSKRQQGPKTGRFGLGFNTAYNLTDYPSFATRDRIVSFDPNQDAVARNDGRPGRRWALDELWRLAPDWPRAFDLPDGATDLQCTTFRLPLRRADQATTARIAQHPVALPDLLQTLDDVGEWGGALLLFTRGLLHLSVQEVSPEGVRVERVSVRTVEPALVTHYRVALNTACNGELPDLLQRWRLRPQDLPRAVYEHRFEVQKKGHVSEDRWLVSAGLFCDEKARLLDQASEMLQIEEKALPLAGAAVRMKDTGSGYLRATTERGALYCTLPLPGTSSLPFHVNGYFDLDRSRTGLPVNEGLVGNPAVRAQWNEALLEHAVAPAIAALICELRQRCGEKAPAAFYAIWPDHAVLARTPLAKLARHVYLRLADQPLLRVRTANQITWKPAGETRTPVDVWSEHLCSALCLDGLPLPDPALPTHIMAGLGLAAAAPSPWTAQELRTRLLTVSGLPVPMGHAPRASLREMRLILELLRFFLSGEQAALTGLPLAVTEDGILRVFGSQYLFRGSEEVRSLFRHSPELFLDQEIERSTTVSAGSDKVYQMTADNVVWAIQQQKLLSPATNATSRPFQALDSCLPNELWLQELFHYLSRQSLEKNSAAFATLTLIPDQFGRLHQIGLPTSPAFGGSPIDAELRAALTAFGVPLLHGSDDLILAVQLAARKHSQLSRPLTGANVVATLAALVDQGGTLSECIDHQRRLLNFLAADDIRTPLDSGQLQMLRRLPLWLTTTGGAVSATGKRTYLPTGYSPPRFTGAITLLDPGPNNRWRSMLVRMDVQPLTLTAYLERMFIPDYPLLSAENQREALRWLRDSAHLSDLEDDVGETIARRVRGKVQATRLVRAEDGNLYAASQFYHPEASDEWAVLGPVARRPDITFYNDSPADWLRLFSSLGMRRQPRADDLLIRIDQLIASVPTVGLDAVEPLLLMVLDYIDSHWERFKGVQVENDKTGFGQALGNRAWLPAVRDPARAAKVAGFRPAAPRLYRPDELFPPRLQHIVASQAPILATSKELHAALRKALSMPAGVPLDLVVRNFCEVRSLWESHGHGGISASAVGEMATETYRALGRRSGKAGYALDEDEPPELPQKLTQAIGRMKEAQCIWHAETARFWAPEHVFVAKIPFFGALRVQIATQGAEGEAMFRLGRRGEPEPKDFVAFLRDLAILQEGSPLDNDYTERALHACLRLEQPEARRLLTPDLPLPCKDGILRPASKTLIDDAPWWRPRLVQVPIPWIHSGLKPRFAEDAGAGRASKLLVETLLAQEPATSIELRAICSALEAHLGCRELRVGLLRLVQAEHGQVPFDIEQVTSLRVIAAARLRSMLTCPRIMGDQTFGEDEVDDFVEERRVYLTADNREDAFPSLSQAINRQLGLFALSDLAPLEDILRRRPDQIESALDRRHIPRPDEQDMEATFSWDVEMGGDEGTPPDSTLPSTGADSHTPKSASGLWGGTGDQGTSSEVVRPDTRPTDPKWRPSANADDPPVEPGTGHSSVRARPSGHLRSYVYSTAHAGGGSLLTGRSGTPQEIEKAALEFVISEEARIGRIVQTPESASQGFDLRVLVQGETEPRNIKVKGLQGTWERRGISLDPAELATAFSLRAKYWLYVVEHALEPTSACLYRIQDPAGHITEFRLDEGWRDLAVPEAKQEPEPGMQVFDGETLLGMIVEVKSYGPIRRLTIGTPAGETLNRPYNPAAHRLSRIE